MMKNKIFIVLLLLHKNIFSVENIPGNLPEFHAIPVEFKLESGLNKSFVYTITQQKRSFIDMVLSNPLLLTKYRISHHLFDDGFQAIKTSFEKLPNGDIQETKETWTPTKTSLHGYIVMGIFFVTASVVKSFFE